MKNKTLTISLIALLLSVTQSCQKEELVVTEKPVIADTRSDEVNRLQTAFARALAKAMKADPGIRAFLKSEAIKQFDKDYDILYQMVKDQPINSGATLHERLASYVTSPEELTYIEDNLPLLTIFIPTLPNNAFSADVWDANLQVPVVAVAKQGDNNVPFYDATGKEDIVPAGKIPSFPIVIIKQNERVTLRTNFKSIGARGNVNNQFLEKENLSFCFTDQAFDGIHSKPKIAARAAYVAQDGRPVGIGIDPLCVQAFQSGAEWQRDFVYYGISPTVPQGKLKRNYRETIRTMKFSGDAFYKMSDQGNDPTPLNTRTTTGGPYWTEGFFEFRIVTLINSKNGLGNDYTRLITVRPDELFDLNYSLERSYYTLRYVSSKEYRAEVDLLTWDLQNYGNAWKIIFYEEDSSDTYSSSSQVTTTYALNFEVDGSVSVPGDIVKIGAKFGGSMGGTETKTITINTTRGSDYLGEIALLFDQPIIISNGPVFPMQGTLMIPYNTFENTTGGSNPILSVSVEPVQFY